MGGSGVAEPLEPKDPETRVAGHPVTMVRDNLAVIRTDLANERTFLAYLRTGLALGAAGSVFVKFMDSKLLVLAGWCLLSLGGLVLVFGGVRFRKTRGVIERISRLEL